MSSKRAQPYRPQSVPMATFEMFPQASASNNVQIPATASAQLIRDQSIRDLFRQLSLQNKKPARINAFNELNSKIPEIQLTPSTEDFLLVAKPCYAIFDSALIDYHSETRLLALKMISLILNIIKDNIKDQLPKIAGIVFPPLILLSCDTNPEVLTEAKNLFSCFFPTQEKRSALMSKLRNEIAIRTKRLLGDIENPEWKLTDSQINENWGRCASMVLLMSSTLLVACHFSRDVFEMLGKPPVKQWLKLTNGQFLPKVTPPMRANAYIYTAITAQCGFVDLNGPQEIKQYITAEGSPMAQEKLIKLILALLEKKKIEKTDIQEPLFNSLFLYYEPSSVMLDKLLTQIQDKEFIQKCLLKSTQSTDLTTGDRLFKIILNAGKEVLSNEFLLKLLEKAVSTSPPNKFFSSFSLDYFEFLKNEPSISTILTNADETRAAEFLSFCETSQIIVWMKNRSSIKPETLIKVIQKRGAVPIRQVWPTYKDIPLLKTKDAFLVKFVLLFAHSDEISYIIENEKDCVPLLLNSWTGDLEPFRTDKLFDIVGEILDHDIKLIRVLKNIFPNNEKLIQIVDETTRRHLKEENEFDPGIFQYYSPSNDLLDDIIFSEAITILEPTDTILIPLLVKRIVELVDTTHPVKLAKIASDLIEVTELDPINICVSPQKSPIFCYEYWLNVGFENMNQPEFCELVECYLKKKCPFLPALLYVQNIDWRIIPNDLYKYIEEHSELAIVAQQLDLLLALAAICFVNKLNLSSFEKVNGITLFANPTLAPVQPIENSKEKEAAISYTLEKDDITKSILCEWNIDIPDLPGENELRYSISYLQHYLPVVEDFAPFIELAVKFVNSDNTLEFFFACRLLAMIYEADQSFDVRDVAFKILEQVDKFYPIPLVVENEIRNAFEITRFLTAAQFEPFVFKCLPYLEKEVSPIVSHLVVPMISFFNSWEIVDTRFNGRLDLDNINCWHFVTTALREMPYKRRIDTIPDFSDRLSPLLSSLRIDSPEFMTLITSFPSSAMKWCAKLPNSRSQPLYSYMEKKGTMQVYRSMAGIALRMKLECTVISEDVHSRTITAIYTEDATSVPVALKLEFPRIYPFAQIKVSCDFGDEGENCAYKVFAAMIGHQSIEAGIIAWHQFVTYRLKEAEPCTVCYSYLSDELKKPKVACPTCGQKFHGKCLQKWFSKCLKPTCPYCASAWDEKKREKKK